MISDAAGNKLLAAMILDLRRRTHIFDTNKIPERRVPGAEEHLAMLEAIEAGSSEVARKLMAEHIENAKLAIINRILSIS
jgi:DNA-binding GntR family transcriptional regulator